MENIYEEDYCHRSPGIPRLHPYSNTFFSMLSKRNLSQEISFQTFYISPQLERKVHDSSRTQRNDKNIHTRYFLCSWATLVRYCASEEIT